MTDRVLLTLENHLIAAKYFSYVFDATGDCSGVCVETENETSECYVLEGNPSFADYYGINLAEDATYEEKRLPPEESGREQDLDPYISYASRVSTQYTPGFVIWVALPSHKCEASIQGGQPAIPVRGCRRIREMVIGSRLTGDRSRILNGISSSVSLNP